MSVIKSHATTLVNNQNTLSEKKPASIYYELSLLPADIADKITNAKTGGGRSLNAIHESKNLNTNQKHLMLILGSEMNYCKNFANQYRYISLNDLARKMSANKSTVSRILNGGTMKGKQVVGLIELGYIIKKIPTYEEQIDGYATQYCLTSKIFDEYMLCLIDRSKNGGEKSLKKQAPKIFERESDISLNRPVGPPSEHGSRVMQVATGVVAQRDKGAVAQRDRGSCAARHKPPVIDPINTNTIILPAADRACTRTREDNTKDNNSSSSKKFQTPTKTWENKSNDEKMDTILNAACDAHRRAVMQRMATPFPFNDTPDLVKKIITVSSLESAKEFFDYLKINNIGCDVRKLDINFKRWSEKPEDKLDTENKKGEPVLERKVADVVVDEKIEAASRQEKPSKIINTTQRSQEQSKIEIETLPVHVQKLYANCSPLQKKYMLKDIAEIGIENFLHLSYVIAAQNTGKSNLRPQI